MVGDYKNLTWLTPHNIHVAGYIRTLGEKRLYCLFNFSDKKSYITWFLFKEHGAAPSLLFDHWSETAYQTGYDHEYLVMESYTFLILETR